MNIEENCFESKSYKVKVPIELINTIPFKQKIIKFYLRILLIPITLYTGVLISLIDIEIYIANILFMIVIIILFLSFLSKKSDYKKITSLMQESYLTKGIVIEVKKKNNDGTIDYNMKIKYTDINNNDYSINKSNDSELKVVDILYSTTDSKDAIIINPNLLNSFINTDEIVKLIYTHATLIK